MLEHIDIRCFMHDFRATEFDSTWLWVYVFLSFATMYSECVLCCWTCFDVVDRFFRLFLLFSSVIVLIVASDLDSFLKVKFGSFFYIIGVRCYSANTQFEILFIKSQWMFLPRFGIHTMMSLSIFASIV